jgi:hypothetical protein
LQQQTPSEPLGRTQALCLRLDYGHRDTLSTLPAGDRLRPAQEPVATAGTGI